MSDLCREKERLLPVAVDRSVRDALGSEIRAVTFDFWNTLFQVGPIMPWRLLQAIDFLRERGSELSDEQIAAHFAEAQRLNDQRWRAGQHFGGAGVAGHLLEAAFGTAREAEVGLLLERFQEPADPSQPVQPVPGVGAALARLRTAGCVMGIVSDTGFLTGASLRRLLEREGLAEYFEPTALAFSDEVGMPKPHPAMFGTALGGLGQDPAAAAHVGDLRFTDVAGSRSIGMFSVRFNGCFDDQESLPDADLVLAAYEELPAVLGF